MRGSCWVQQDPLNQVGDVQEANRYVYAGNNPVDFTDPSGCSIRKFVTCVSTRVSTKYAVTVARCSRLLSAPVFGWQAFLGCVGVFCGPKTISAAWRCKGRL